MLSALVQCNLDCTEMKGTQAMKFGGQFSWCVSSTWRQLFSSKHLQESTFPRHYSSPISIKHFPTLTYRNPKTTLEKTSSSQVLMRWLLISRQLLCHPVAWIFARNIPHPPTERCVNSTIWRLGGKLRSLSSPLHMTIQEVYWATPTLSLHSSLPAPGIKEPRNKLSPAPSLPTYCQ